MRRGDLTVGNTGGVLPEASCRRRPAGGVLPEASCRRRTSEAPIPKGLAWILSPNNDNWPEARTELDSAADSKQLTRRSTVENPGTQVRDRSHRIATQLNASQQKRTKSSAVRNTGTHNIFLHPGACYHGALDNLSPTLHTIGGCDPTESYPN